MNRNPVTKTTFYLRSLTVLLTMACSSCLAASDQTNRVLSLDGRTGSYVIVPSSPELQNSTEITIEAWIYPLLTANSKGPGFLNKGDGGSASSSRSYELGLDLSGQFGSGMKVALSLFLGSDTWALHEAPIRYAEWTHVAGTYSSTRGLFQIFINGELVGSTTNDASTTVRLLGKTLRQTTLPLVFGENPLVSGTFTTGMMDEVRIWNKARTAQEISENMSRRLSGSEASLAGYWNFDDGSARDLTGNGHNGGLNGNALVVPIQGVDVVHVNTGPVFGFDVLRLGYSSVRGFRQRIQGPSGSAVGIESSTNLMDWQPLIIFTDISGAVEFIDLSATNYTKRFYRMALPK